jgi:23S rRNA (cytidine1920-2'-O)/16S rRNA (cytidine1409-2'-O)-methyltransferase
VVARRRLDAELVRRGLAASRTEAQDQVDAGLVLVNGAVAGKPARLVAAGDAVVVADPPARFVGRGGEKLDAAIEHFRIDVSGRRALDVGASTGGFTDCLLSRGAAHVVALDVGHGQLHPRLRHDPRVTVLERTNIRTATIEMVGGAVELAVVDVAFISLTVVIPVLVGLCQPGSPMVLLVKPQFEAGRAEVGRGKGIVTDPAVHARVRDEIERALTSAGCTIGGWMESPIRGGHGNREFLVHAITSSGAS